MIQAIFDRRDVRRRALRFKRRAEKLRPKTHESDNRGRRLVMYFFRLREDFLKARVVHFACDASRLGFRNRLLGFLTRTDGIGAWMPPMAIL